MSDERSMDLLMALPAELRRAALVTLVHAREEVADRWPTPAIIKRFAKLFGVSLSELAAVFGIIAFRHGNGSCYLDTLRTGLHPMQSGAWITSATNAAFEFYREGVGSTEPRIHIFPHTAVAWS